MLMEIEQNGNTESEMNKVITWPRFTATVAYPSYILGEV